VTRALFANQRVVIVGLARQGSAMARFFCAQRAEVVVTDLSPASALQEAVASLDGLPIQYVFGEHPFSLLDRCDLVCLSGGVPPETPFPQEARRRGIPLSNDSLLTLRLAPSTVVGVTGSSGKTTTTSLVGAMLEAAGYKTWVGGNIGAPLLDRVDEMAPEDRVVLELSSFQLQLFAGAPDLSKSRSISSLLEVRGPHVGAILNITPNHLDRHLSMAHYVAAKANILCLGTQVAVLGADDPIVGRWYREGRVEIEPGVGQDAVRFALPSRTIPFSLMTEMPEGAFLRRDRLFWRYDGSESEICTVHDLKLLGQHNVANMLAAFAISGAVGATPAAMAQVATSFTGVPHRLELVRDWQGVRWYNDSIATTPERVAAALRSFREPLVLLAGGRDKHLPWEEMADLTLQRVRCLILFGEAADLIAQAVDAAQARSTPSRSLAVVRCSSLGEAVRAAARVARPGEVVLLSPGGTSFDAYRDFEQRGEHFRSLVEALPAT
jgi:UDP-N-acetylmuramoylalanine--D-glutamate ligase